MNSQIPPVPGAVPPVPSSGCESDEVEVVGACPPSPDVCPPAPDACPPVPRAGQGFQPSSGLPEITFVLSHMRGFFMNTSGGRIHITADCFYFQPHNLNFDLNTYRWTYDQIAGYSRGPLTYFRLHLTNGKTETFVTYKKQKLYEALEKYRQAWFAARGLIAPQLTRKL